VKIDGEALAAFQEQYPRLRDVDRAYRGHGVLPDSNRWRII
jgi:hypothetical protein